MIPQVREIRSAVRARVLLTQCSTRKQPSVCLKIPQQTRCLGMAAPPSSAASLSAQGSHNGSSLAESSNIQGTVRHGKGDAVILLNVGGTQFFTLRSTVAANAVLADHVARAEANRELSHDGKAVFIDRDPTHFPLILNHLRNKVEGLSYNHSHTKKFRTKEAYVQLPKDSRVLRDIYVEAQHYGIRELSDALCQQSVVVNLVGVLSGGASNPFDQVAKWGAQLRRTLIFTGGLGTVVAGAQPDQDGDRFLNKWLSFLGTSASKDGSGDGDNKALPAP